MTCNIARKPLRGGLKAAKPGALLLETAHMHPIHVGSYHQPRRSTVLLPHCFGTNPDLLDTKQLSS